MMKNISNKIKKLIKALETRREIYLFTEIDILLELVEIYKAGDASG